MNCQTSLFDIPIATELQQYCHNQNVYHYSSPFDVLIKLVVLGIHSTSDSPISNEEVILNHIIQKKEQHMIFIDLDDDVWNLERYLFNDDNNNFNLW